MKYILLILVFIVGIVVYLNKSYSRIYDHIALQGLPDPTAKREFVIESASTTPSSSVRYLVLGDSLTIGAGTSQPQESYPYLFAKQIMQQRNAVVELHNAGQLGAVSADVLKQQLPIADSFRPNIISLLIGINDIHNFVPASIFRKNFADIIEKIAQPNTQVIVINIPYLGAHDLFWPPYNWYFDFKTKQFNKVISEVISGKENIQYIDLYSKTKEDFKKTSELYSSDLFHPSPKGYALWANFLYDSNH